MDQLLIWRHTGLKIIYEKRVTGCQPCEIRNFINCIMERINSWKRLSDENEYQIRLILNELIANGTIHGNKGICTKGITASVMVSEADTLCITIQDDGKGFNYNEICGDNAISIPDPYSECGRGLKLIKAICDDIKFNQSGNKIRILKSLNQQSIH